MVIITYSQNNNLSRNDSFHQWMSTTPKEQTCKFVGATDIVGCNNLSFTESNKLTSTANVRPSKHVGRITTKPACGKKLKCICWRTR
ncbi:hypothetical protein OSB04_028796 [Centaurea solstitialis]|uniref:Uncharacterized protein n=1 Tax=Centaurea solstitialis TaxID=347529 RepID=A0AA38STW9_9ASTR|nr:hypothetical protein OSB04_028796 [Centaurea solstitialis]